MIKRIENAKIYQYRIEKCIVIMDYLSNLYNSYYLEQATNNQTNQTGFGLPVSGRNRFLLPQLKRLQYQEKPSEEIKISSVPIKVKQHRITRKRKIGIRKRPVHRKQSSKILKRRKSTKSSKKVKQLNKKTKRKNSKVKVKRRRKGHNTKAKSIDIFS